MKLSQKPGRSRRGPSTRRLRSPRARRVLLIAVYTVLVFAAGALGPRLVDRLGLSPASVKRSLASAHTRLRAALAEKPEVERLAVDIKFRHYLRMARQRQVALARFHLEVDEDDYVPATLRHGDRVVRARARLKGDWIDHLDTNKWSMRFQVRGEDTLLGMKRFSIQHPKTRNYIYEWLYHRALRREDVLSLRYEFVDVTLNGDRHGLYAIEEHFEKRLVEHNRRPEGPIVRFDENLMFQRQIRSRPFREIGVRQRAENTAESGAVEEYLAAEIDTFQSGRMLSDPEAYARHTAAIHLLEAFRRGELSTSEVFDVEKLARYLAVSDLMGAGHSVDWRNLRFYHNPITSLLEPIGFDGDAGQLRRLSCVIDTVDEEHAPIGERRALFVDRVFADLAFFEAYIGVLERISQPRYLEEWLAEIDEELRQTVNLLQAEFPEFRFSEQVLYRNSEYIRNALSPVKGIHAHYRGSEPGWIELELGNIQSLPVEVLGLTHEGSLVELPSRTILPAALLHPPRPVEYEVLRLPLPGGFEWSTTTAAGLRLAYRILGTTTVREAEVIPWPHLGETFGTADPVRAAANWRTFDFLTTGESAGEILVKPGRWSIDRNLVIPEGFRVVAGEGTRLDLSNAALVLSYSPLRFKGTDESPIVIGSRDGTGQGLVLIGAGELSVLEHVTFENLASPATEGWRLTGAVTFYESPVRLANCRFSRNRSEDALHVIRSAFELERSVFEETPSDAFDSDFSEGGVRGCRFVEIGNDAVDVSGSLVEIEDLTVRGSGDKALSAGERSQVNATGLDIRRAEIALASKDSSTVTVAGAEIADGPIGLTAFQKKSEFGPASMEVFDLRMRRVTTPRLVEVGSWLLIDGKRIEGTETDLRDVLYDD
jgi:hypothetical protein